MISALHQLIRDAAHQVFQPLSVFLLSIYRLTLSNAFFVLPGDGVVAIGFVERFLIVVEDILLAGTNLRVYFGAALWPMPEKNSRINQPQPKGRTKPPRIGLRSICLCSFRWFAIYD